MFTSPGLVMWMSTSQQPQSSCAPLCGGCRPFTTSLPRLISLLIGLPRVLELKADGGSSDAAAFPPPSVDGGVDRLTSSRPFANRGGCTTRRDVGHPRSERERLDPKRA